ncbi:MAG: hypothetical protein U0031_06490 [Thermomicrobiales bacterium]
MTKRKKKPRRQDPVCALPGAALAVATGKFNEPHDLAVTQERSIYVAAMFNHRIQKFDAEGNFAAGETYPAEWSIGGPGSSGIPPTPWDVAVTADAMVSASYDSDREGLCAVLSIASRGLISGARGRKA